MQNIDLIQWIAFVILSILVLGGGLLVVTDRNLFHGALWLLVSLFGVAGLFVMLSAPFLAAVQVLVYMGAIVILIIFAIMLTRRMMGIRESVNARWPIGLVMSALAFLVVSFILTLASSSQLLAYPANVAVQPDSLINFGKALVDTNQYALPFELASLLLTAALIGSIVIAREDG
ncbi:MAG: NADH-quinone oxidoreductase subunit J [Chloroflexota bacterium]